MAFLKCHFMNPTKIPTPLITTTPTNNRYPHLTKKQVIFYWKITFCFFTVKVQNENLVFAKFHGFYILLDMLFSPPETSQFCKNINKKQNKKLAFQKKMATYAATAAKNQPLTTFTFTVKAINYGEVSPGPPASFDLLDFWSKSIGCNSAAIQRCYFPSRRGSEDEWFGKIILKTGKLHDIEKLMKTYSPLWVEFGKTPNRKSAYKCQLFDSNVRDGKKFRVHFPYQGPNGLKDVHKDALYRILIQRFPLKGRVQDEKYNRTNPGGIGEVQNGHWVFWPEKQNADFKFKVDDIEINGKKLVIYEVESREARELRIRSKLGGEPSAEDIAKEIRKERAEKLAEKKIRIEERRMENEKRMKEAMEAEQMVEEMEEGQEATFDEKSYQEKVSEESINRRKEADEIHKMASVYINRQKRKGTRSLSKGEITLGDDDNIEFFNHKWDKEMAMNCESLLLELQKKSKGHAYELDCWDINFLVAAFYFLSHRKGSINREAVAKHFEQFKDSPEEAKKSVITEFGNHLKKDGKFCVDGIEVHFARIGLEFPCGAASVDLNNAKSNYWK